MSRTKTFSVDQYIVCYTKYVHTSRVCDEIKINSLVSFSFYSGRAMNTNEKREQKAPMKFVELVETKTEIMAR